MQGKKDIKVKFSVVELKGLNIKLFIKNFRRFFPVKLSSLLPTNWYYL